MMCRSVIKGDNAPKAIGPYSQAIRSGSTVYASGQLGIDPLTGFLVTGGIGPQTHRALTNIQAILDAAGSGLDQVLKTTIFMTDIEKFDEMNKVYSEFFPTLPPARSTVQVSALPKGAEIEIECIALVKA